MLVRIHVRKRGREIERLRHELYGRFPGKRAPVPHVTHELLNDGGNRDREKNAEETGELGPDDERKNYQYRGYADNTRDDQRIDEVVLELLKNNVERDNEKP